MRIATTAVATLLAWFWFSVPFPALTLGAIAAGAVTGGGAAAQVPALTIGEPAPPLTLRTWLNLPEGAKPPTLESLRGRAIMLEFWGTWCGPCVRAMPEVQKLHDRYADRGLTVLAISYEPPAKMQPFLEEHGYTMAVGSDPEKAVVAAYGVRSWPTTVLLDKEGRVAYVGNPYGAEAAVEKALGLESSPATLLTAYLDGLVAAKKEAQRDALARLCEKAAADFDLAAWARSNGGGEEAVAAPKDAAADMAAPAEAAAKEEKEEAPADAKPAANAAEDARTAAALLTKCAAAWKDQKKRTHLLQRLAVQAPATFDLAAWAREAFAAAFPLDAKEMAALLRQKKYGDAVTALIERRPPAAVVAAAGRDKDLREFCRTKAPQAREMAKKAIMVQGWVFGSVQPKDNDAFWRELAVSGIATSKDQKQITGVLLGGGTVTRGMAEAFIRSHLAQALVMADLAAGKAPPLRELDALVRKEREKATRDLEQRYGELDAAANGGRSKQK